MDQRWRLYDEVTCPGWCQLTLSGPWVLITWLHLCPSSHIGQPQAVASGQPNISSQTFSRLSLTNIIRRKEEEQPPWSWGNSLRPIEGLPGLAAILRHLAASGESSLVTSGAVVTSTSWGPGSVVSRPGVRGRIRSLLWSPLSHETLGDDRRSLRLGRGRGWCLWTGAWLRTEAGTVTGDWGWGPRPPLLPTLSSGNIITPARTSLTRPSDKIFQILLSTQMCFKASLFRNSLT